MAALMGPGVPAAPLDPIQPGNAFASPKPDVTYRRFDDIDGQRQDVYNSALSALRSFRPVENATHRLEIADVDYDGPFTPTKSDEKKMILQGASLHRPLRGTVRLIDKATNQPMDEQRVTLARIPHVNSRGLFIRNGVVWSVRNQARLRPGAYTRARADGGTETHFNVRPGSGRGFRILLEPQTGLMKMQVGQSTTRLYPLLRSLGIPDDQIRESWGEDLYQKNYRAPSGNDIKDLQKVVAKLGSQKVKVDDDLLPQALKDLLAKAEIDPETAKLTLGEEVTNLSPELLLRTTQRILRVARGEEDGDNRDSQAYQSIHGAEDFIRERLQRDQVGALRNLLWKASRAGKLGNVPTGVLDKNIGSIFEGSGLALAVEDINPFEIHDQRQAITRLGQGGISSEQAVSRDARGVQASYIGVIDAGRGPESSKLGLDLRVTDAAMKGSDNQLYTTVMNHRTNEPEVISARDLSTKVVTFPGEMERDAKRIPAIKGDKVQYVTRDEVDYVIPDANSMMSRATAMIPFPQSIKGQRLLMGARMTQQAMPLKEPEAPLVQTALPDGRSMHQEMGRFVGAAYSPVEGTVLSVDNDQVKIRTREGETKIVDLYNNYPSARKTMLHNTPMVERGAQVKAGDLLAKSNFTDDQGTAAVGRNLRVAFMAAEGDTIEDAYVISEAAAKKLTSEALYKSDLDMSDVESTKKADYIATYANKFDQEQYDKIDDEGVVQIGAEVMPGDPLILGFGRRDQKAIGALMNTPRSQLSDRTQTWDHHAPGVVTDVSRTRKGIKVTVKSYDMMHAADKLTGRFGNKGVISEIRPDDQMPMTEDGEPVEVIANALGIVSRTNPGALAEVLLGKVARKRGKPYVIKGFDNEDVTEFALQEAIKYGIIEQDPETGKIRDTETLIDPRDGSKIPNIFTGESYFMKPQHMAESKLGARDVSTYTTEGIPARGGKEGCFFAGQKVLTDQGSVEIGHLCEKRLGLSVLTWDGTDWVYRPVTDWFVYRAEVSDLVTVKFMAPASDRGVFKKNSARHVVQSFSATKNHEIILEGGVRKLAGDLTVEDELLVRGTTPTEHQWSALVGTLLGDASIHLTDTCYVFQAEHSKKQKAYVDWKQSLFAGLGARWYDGEHAPGEIRGKVRSRVSSRTVTWTAPGGYLRDLYEMFYTGSAKRVTASIAQAIDERALVVWFIDDGWLSSAPKKKGQSRLTGGFATDGFDEESVDALIDRFQQLTGHSAGKTCVCGGQWRISIGQKACQHVAELVSKYIPSAAIPKSKKWLRQYVEDRQTHKQQLGWDTSNRLALVPAKIVSIEPYVHDKPNVEEINVYDITVDETHLYCAGGALVSNSKRVAMLDAHALLAAGATEFLKDAKLVRGQRNDDYWRAVRAGETPVAPTRSFADDHFKDLLRAAGVRLREKGTRTQLSPMTDRDVDALAAHEIENPGTFNFETMKPVPGGLFDMRTTGGSGGNRFSKITLPVPVPHPLFVDPIQKILGLTGPAMEAVMTGKQKLGNETGPGAIYAALKTVNVDKEMDLAKEMIRSGRKTHRDKAMKKLNFLAGLKKMDLAPEDLMVTKIPVIPPKYRPIVSARGMDMVHDLNYLYHDLLEARKNYGDAKETFGDAGDEYLTMANAVQAISGVRDPVNPKSAEQGVKGVLRYAIGVGDTPKSAFYQRKVIGSAVDTVGRGVITADSKLDMDQISLPKDMAYKIFRPYVIRRLGRMGMTATDALEAVNEHKPVARKALEEEMKVRPVVYNRAPALHRYAYVGAYAQLRDDDAIGLPYHTLKGIGGDYDGDQINVHVPASAEAQSDARDKLMPSKNLFFTGTYETHYEPMQDYLAGLYLASTPDMKEPVQTFASETEARRAFARGEINARTPIRIIK